jgi:hypothetical protein
MTSLAACLHYDLPECTRHSPGVQCWESSDHDEKGRLRHVMIEQVRPGDRCDRVRIEWHTFDEHGVMVKRTVDERTCDVVDLRMIDRYDLGSRQISRELYFDDNHDDRFDRVVQERLPLSEAQEHMVTHRLDEDARELKAAHDRK